MQLSSRRALFLFCCPLMLAHLEVVCVLFKARVVHVVTSGEGVCLPQVKSPFLQYVD